MKFRILSIDLALVHTFCDRGLSGLPVDIITKGATSVVELDSGTVGIAADEDDDVVDMAPISCCIMDSMLVILSAIVSGDAKGDDGVITGSLPMADRVLICMSEPPKEVGRLKESPVSESLGFMLA